MEQLSGTPEVVDGIVGSALLFDGVDDGVKLPDSVGIIVKPTTKLTYSGIYARL